MTIAFFLPAKIYKRPGNYIIGATAQIMFPGLKLFFEQIDLLSFYTEDKKEDCRFKQELDSRNCEAQAIAILSQYLGPLFHQITPHFKEDDESIQRVSPRMGGNNSL